MRDLSRLFRPRSIAVMGGGWARNVVEQCLKAGYEGGVWPVHPEKPEICGVRAWRSLAELPEPPDACFVGVNRHATVDVVAELSAMGAGGAICFASGWSETGDAGLQEALVAAAGEMPILGPNCYGVLNYLDGAAIWPDQHGGRRVETGVAIVSQSSNIAINLTMQRRGLPIAYVACLGNAAQCGPATLSAALLDDPRVTALGLYLEGIDDPGALAALAEEARAAGKGCVALKSGKTEMGIRAAASHTASLAGEREASTAFLRQSGIAEVATLSELIETLKILHGAGPLRGRRVSASCCSGGEAGLVADLAASTGLDVPDPVAASRDRLSAVLGTMVALANPLDYQTFIWGDEQRTTEVFSAMLAGMDAGLFVIDPPRGDRCDPSSFAPAMASVAAAGRESGRPAFAVSSLPESMDEVVAERFSREGVVPLAGLETALAAVDAAATPAGRAGWRPWNRPALRPTRLLPEDEAKARLAAAGIAVPNGVSAASLSGLACRAHILRPPLALKGLGFAHKTESGAVRLGLSSLDGEAEMPGATGYLAEEMVPGGLAELIVGVRRNAVYGATLTVGFGGVVAELLADVQTLVLPVVPKEVEAAFRRLRLWPLLDGYRGRERPSMDSVVAAAMVLQDLLAGDPRLEEAEINPLIATSTGAVAADALIREATA
jgi:acyl-CoA synthetase (NDP forming)